MMTSPTKLDLLVADPRYKSLSKAFGASPDKIDEIVSALREEYGSDATPMDYATATINFAGRWAHELKAREIFKDARIPTSNPVMQEHLRRAGSDVSALKASAHRHS